MVVGMSLYSQIREAYISGESQRSIARRLKVSRQTVKKYCEGETMPGVRKDYLRNPSVVTPEVGNFIRMCLETDKEEGLRKQTHTAKRIYDRLVAETDFLRMCVDYGEDRVIFAKNRIPAGITPTIDIIRSYLEEPERDAAICFRNEVYITRTNLAYYDEKCGVVAR